MPIKVIVEKRLARVTLHAPPLNILTSQLANQLREAFEALRHRHDFNALVIDSALPDVFSAGADVREHIGRDACERMLKAAHAMIAELLRLPVPTICVVAGKCLGGGFELALACDQLRVTPQSTLGTPEITLGCYPPAALVLMPWKFPSSLAAELVQTGTPISGKDLIACGAARSGGIDGLAETYASLPRGPLVEATRLLRAGAAERFLAQVGGIEQAYLERLLAMPDATEGPNSFLEKRKPAWDHRGPDRQ